MAAKAEERLRRSGTAIGAVLQAEVINAGISLISGNY